MRSTPSRSGSTGTPPGRRCCGTRSAPATRSSSFCSATTAPRSSHVRQTRCGKRCIRSSRERPLPRPLMQVLVLNGVNLDTLARRDPSVYGGVSLNELETKIYEWAQALGISARCRQSNSEGEYIEWIHDAYDNVDALIVNPGAWSHYSYAIRDALELADVPIVEVHLSNIEEREDWRRVSVVADVVAGHEVAA